MPNGDEPLRRKKDDATVKCCNFRKTGINSSTNTKWIDKSNECQRWIQRTWLKYDLIMTDHWPPMTLYNINRLKFGISAVDSIFYGDDKGCIHLVELSLNDLALRPIKSEEEDGFIINFLRFVKLRVRQNKTKFSLDQLQSRSFTTIEVHSDWVTRVQYIPTLRTGTKVKSRGPFWLNWVKSWVHIFDQASHFYLHWWRIFDCIYSGRFFLKLNKIYSNPSLSMSRWPIREHH